MPNCKYNRRRGSELIAALAAVRLLRAGRWTMTAMGAEIGLSRRQTYRLIDALAAAGLPAEKQPEGREVFYRISRETIERAFGLGEK